ncbi:6-carboxyhexanoate--CoA ligase [Corynebacterium sp. 13CS0277]|uniref:6-carboxyhexanoate--CoA ligase n=1 Tax=Corynebacterium sp. 13CS0277 TaxID=2071994 RepID=UPI000D0393FA|nr:6-carboxyhexanoate--CoA ligase [Corynebacterium sp. 13CS0277]PRQ11859.1 6-carboxyhexanoate--CoA ligase [Corynebacterium sp. 13CS0277]
MYSLRMRASRDGAHINGAERLAEADALPGIASELVARALNHPKGTPDSIRLSADVVDDVEYLPQLTVCEHTATNPAEADAIILGLLAHVPARTRVLELVRSVTGLRGAMVVSASTGDRLEADPARGVRVSHIDHAARTDSSAKNHRLEALALATKVLAPEVCVAEVCISDDPDYTTGYVSTGRTYHRITGIKAPGSPQGTRVFVVDATSPTDPRLADAIAFWEGRAVVVEP